MDKFVIRKRFNLLDGMEEPKETTKDGKQLATPTSPYPGNMEVSTIDFFKVVGDITPQFFKLDKLFKRFEMKDGGRQHALFKTYNVNNVEATLVTLLSP